MKRDLISLIDLNQDEILKMLELTGKLKKNRTLHKDMLTGKSVGLVFQKPSNRTRVSFEVGIHELGGNCIYLGPEEINLGVRESTSDVASTLSRYLGCIVARTNSHKDILELSKHSSVPVINGLCDLYHPCQGLTDLYSIHEKLGDLSKLTVAFIGDGNNVCHSLLLGCSKVGMNINIATPKGYEPNVAIVKKAMKFAAKTGSKIMVMNNAMKAAKGVSVIYSDVWVSMGQEDESEEKIAIFKDYQINKKLTAVADKNYIFMHCLPAHRGLEVTKDVIDGKHSIVFDQAENRLHTQKAILVSLLAASKSNS